VAKQSGLGDNFYVGAFNLSGDTNSLGSITSSRATIGVTGIDKSAQERIHGIKDGGFEFMTYFNPSASQAHPVLKALPTTDVVCSYFRGTTIGSAAASCIGKQINYDPVRNDSGEFTFKTSVQGNGYGLEWGQMLTSGIRTDTTATSPATGLDTLASASFGGQAYLHVFSVTGTSVTVAIQDSADNATFAALGSPMTFTAVNGAATSTQRIAISNTSTIRRYVRVITTGTFSNAQFAVNLVKNAEAGVVF
jgi:hypothetical protein